QAEDGIRDRNVTGVQTCALPILNSMRRFATQELDSVLITQPVGPLDGIVHMPIPVVLAHVTQRCTDTTLGGNSVRSEERRVGKGRRSLCSRSLKKQKTEEMIIS